MRSLGIGNHGHALTTGDSFWSDDVSMVMATSFLCTPATTGADSATYLQQSCR